MAYRKGHRPPTACLSSAAALVNSLTSNTSAPNNMWKLSLLLYFIFNYEVDRLHSRQPSSFGCSLCSFARFPSGILGRTHTMHVTTFTVVRMSFILYSGPLYTLLTFHKHPSTPLMGARIASGFLMIRDTWLASYVICFLCSNKSILFHCYRCRVNLFFSLYCHYHCCQLLRRLIWCTSVVRCEFLGAPLMLQITINL